ncbi:unnamed protein product [Clonostachys rhizophaga]|uniref:Hydantoinase B/oxoprolinase domain-containing protein n=1 Tax=Clonostachys rhizophaga TaxID=160324 RepID=A0A9N9YGB5_9HYPO|nr:unnamed protein product [Clonostachys rhizophaga]
MNTIQDNAAQSMRELLKSVAAYVLESTEMNDDGIVFKHKVTTDKETGEAVLDFTGDGFIVSEALGDIPP